MKYKRNISIMVGLLLVVITTLFITGCQKSAVDPNNMTDDEYVQSVISGGYNNDYTNEDNIT
ncbi:MAG: hypothetical protein WCK13_09795, partial [Ignavibacteriota bacterium]